MFDESGFDLNSLFPQGNPLELGSMLAHDPEGVIPQLAAEGITPAMFEQRAFGGAGGLGGLTSGQLLNTAGQYGVPVTSGPQQSVMPPVPVGGIGPQPPVSRPVQTLSFPRPPDATPAAPAPIPASTPPGYQDTPAPPAATTTQDPAGQNASATATKEELQKAKTINDLQRALAGVRMPAAPTPIIPRPGTAGPPAVRPINPQSAITALLAQALGGGKAAPSLGSLIRR